MIPGWQTKPLGELCSIELGKTPSRSNSALWDAKRETGNVWLSIADLLQAEDNMVMDSKEYVSDKGAAICKPVPKGTLLVSFKLTLGRLAFAGRDLFTNEAIAALTPFDEKELSKDFLFYFLHYFDWVKAAENDVKLKGMTLNKAKLSAISVRFPSAEKQKRIVVSLDVAFEAIASAAANASKNLTRAGALIASQRDRIFRDRGAAWAEKRETLFELCDLIVDCEHKTAPTQAEGIPSIRTPNIGNGELLLDNVYRVSEATYRGWTRRAVPMEGDLILAREAPAGNVAVIPRGLRVCLGQRTVLIRPRRDVFEPQFLAMLLLQPDMQRKLLGHSRGATVQHVNMKDIRALRIGAVPSLEVQRSIVARVKAASDQNKQLASV